MGLLSILLRGEDREKLADARAAESEAKADYYRSRATIAEDEADARGEIPRHTGTLRRSMQGRPYTAYTSGTPLEWTPQDPAEVEYGGLPPGAVVDAPGQAVQGRVPWSSTDQMLAEDPRAAGAYGGLVRAGVNPFGKGKGGLQWPTIEDTAARIATDTRMEEARGLAKQAADLIESAGDPKLSPAERARRDVTAVSLLFRADAITDPGKASAQLANLRAWLKDPYQALEVSRAVDDMRDVVVKVGRGEAVTPDDLVTFMNVALTHEKSTPIRYLTEQVALPLFTAPAADPVLKTIASGVQAYLADTGDDAGKADRAIKAMVDYDLQATGGFNTAKLFMPKDAPGSLGRYLPDFFRDALGLPATIAKAAALAEAKETGATKKLKEAQAGAAEVKTDPTRLREQELKTRIDALQKERQGYTKNAAGLVLGKENKARVAAIDAELGPLEKEYGELLRRETAPPGKGVAPSAPTRPAPVGPADRREPPALDPARLKAERDAYVAQTYGQPFQALTPEQKAEVARYLNSRLGGP